MQLELEFHVMCHWLCSCMAGWNLLHTRVHRGPGECPDHQRIPCS